jgi:hypothetical protein
MRVLLIAPYPPPFDARTRAALQEVRRLRAAGDHVEVLTPAPTAAAHHRELGSWAACASIARLVRGFDRVLVAEDLAVLPPLRAALRVARGVETWRAPDAPAPEVAADPGTVAATAAAWSSDRQAVMGEIRARAAHREGPATGARDLGARLRQVPPLALPAAESARPGAGSAKRVVRRLTAWEVDPLVAQVNALRAALIDALEAVERRDDR